MTLTKRKPGSKLQEWVWGEEDLPSAQSFEEKILYMLFKAISAFDSPETTEGHKNHSPGILEALRHHYNKDPELFEVGCYILFQIDRWHEDRQLSYAQSETGPFLKRQYARLFNKFLGIINSAELIKNRIALYRKFENPQSSAEQLLAEFIFKSNSVHQPEAYSEASTPPFSEKIPPKLLFQQITIYKTLVIPGLLKNIEGIYHCLGLMNR